MLLENKNGAIAFRLPFLEVNCPDNLYPPHLNELSSCLMEQINKFEEDRFSTRVFHRVVIFIGVIVFLYSLVNLPLTQMGWEFCIIALVTLAIGSRIALYFELFKSSISVADVFIYLTAILFSGEAATVLVVFEAYISSSRFTKRIEFRAFNSGILATSIFISYKISWLVFGSLTELLKSGITFKLFGATALMISSHYLINSSVVAISTALRTNKPMFETWRECYVWMFIPFMASGSVALVAANAVQTSGFYSFLVILPIIGIIYFSYFSQQGKIQAITEQASQAKRHLLEMTESEARFRSAFNNAPIAIALMSSEGKWLQANDSLCQTFGCSEEEFLSKTLHSVVHPEDLGAFLKHIDYVLHGERQSLQTEVRFLNHKGEELWTQTSLSLLNDSENLRLICQIQDITARRRAEEKLRHDVFHDSLTDLANRTMLIKELNRAISAAKQQGSNRFVAIFVDLDRFKLVNDSIGHRIGDELLIAVSQRLKKCLPSNSTLARLGSDEFFVLVENDQLNIDNIKELVKEIQNQIAAEFSIFGHQINITGSIGIVRFDEVHHTAEDVLRDANAALHLAKMQGRSKYVVFDEQMRKKANNQIRLEKDLQGAVERKELFLLYQPILSLEDKRLAGFEALVRWQHPKLGLVSPMDFIPLAEERGAIVKIGEFVLDEACRQIKEWQNEFAGDIPFTVSVNVSAKQLLQKQFFANIVDVLELHKVEPSQIKLEITESIVVENSDVVTSILRQLRALGIKLSMDDFGTGYSSLSYLHQLPISTLKIDRSFISQMTEETESAEIVRTILLLAKNLNLEVVAEGIETQTQHEVLNDLKCEFGQGYHFSKPLSVADALEFIKNSSCEYNFVGANGMGIHSSAIEH